MTIKSRYQVKGDYIFQNSVNHKTTGNFYVAIDEIEFYTTANTEITHLRIGSPHDQIYYSCELETLVQKIEDNAFETDTRDEDGADVYLVPVKSTIWKKHGAVKETSAEDTWSKQKLRIIESSGGLWSPEKMASWADKFKYKAPTKY
jgi:hypothetical protein